eukprot:Gb_35526 [translate_table: standard]
MVRSGEILQIRHLGGQGRLSYWGIGSWVFLYLLRWLWKIEGNQSQVWRSFAGEHMQSFGTSVRRSSSDENYVVRCDELGSRMGSNVLRSSWVQRLRPAGLSVKAREIEGTRAGPSRASEEKLGSAFYGKGPSGALLKGPGAVSREDKTESEEIDKESRLAIYPELLPNVESILGEPSKVQQRPRTSASEIKADLVTETQVIAGFGPFQIRARSLIAPKPSIGNPTLTPVPADDWKQYYHPAKKEHTTEHRPITAHSGISRWEIHSRTTNEDGDIREFRGGFPGPAPMAPYLYPNWENKAVVNDTGKKLSHLHSGPYCRTNNYANDNERLSKLQWHTARLHPGETRENVGLHKETVPLTRDRVVSGTGMEMDATQSANAVPIRIGNKIESDGFAKCPPPKTLTSSFTRFGGAKQISGIENCTHRSFLDQKSVWKQQSEAFPNVKANRLEVGNFRGKLCSEPSSLTPLLAPRRFGIAEEIGRFDSMEMPPVYTSHGKQNDEITPSDSSSSTASLPNEVYAQLCNRMNNEKKSSECHVHAATGTALICQHNAGYYRPTRELNYLEPESNSSHYSSCPWPDQEDILTRADKKDVRFSKKPEIARHGSSDVKGKASNIQKPLREQCHKRKCIGSSKGAASHYNSRDDGIDLTFQVSMVYGPIHCIFNFSGLEQNLLSNNDTLSPSSIVCIVLHTFHTTPNAWVATVLGIDISITYEGPYVGLVNNDQCEIDRYHLGTSDGLASALSEYIDYQAIIYNCLIPYIAQQLHGCMWILVQLWVHSSYWFSLLAIYFELATFVCWATSQVSWVSWELW